ncbi:class C sortase [Ruminococcus sp. CLA-AA-H200]|uniref:Class C sortase n=1 Tax=Ruminococcus turbiniformis TaxID=2881258 RepID=A0ABS8FZ17_9FIRM|nr:class C sortase [Ruminococcus turbiniformis]MCC2254548.1 class C sortase [Ruminococcus turbiniformis]
MIRKWVYRLIFFLGFLLICYPLVSNIVQRQHQHDAVATYQSEMSQKDEGELEDELNRAKEYNSMLYQTEGAVVDNMDTGILSDESYQSLLAGEDGVMGSIEIPKIGVDLPIYHGTSDDVLAIGAGHLQGTSLPVGGQNTHSVITGHRGLPGSKLFTRLDEIIEGDFVFINVMGETLAYKVTEIQVIEPDDVSVLDIEEGKDLLSLITCTPYGINTHRLVVTGERVDYEETQYENISEAIPSLRELAFLALPFVIIIIGLIVKIIDWRKNRYV